MLMLWVIVAVVGQGEGFNVCPAEGWELDYTGTCPSCVSWYCEPEQDTNVTFTGMLHLTSSGHSAPCTSAGCKGPRMVRWLEESVSDIDFFASFFDLPDANFEAVYVALHQVGGGWTGAVLSRLWPGTNYSVAGQINMGLANQSNMSSSGTFTVTDWPSYQLRLQVSGGGVQVLHRVSAASANKFCDDTGEEPFEEQWVSDGFFFSNHTYDAIAVGITVVAGVGNSVDVDFAVVDFVPVVGEGCGEVQPESGNCFGVCPNPEEPLDWGPCEAAIERALGIVLAGGCVTLAGVVICGR